MFKSVTKWLGVDTPTNPGGDNKHNDAVGIAKSEAEGGEVNTANLAAAATTEESPRESASQRPPAEVNQDGDGKKRVSTENKTSGEGDVEDSFGTDAALHKLEDATAVALDTAKHVGNLLYSFGRTAGSTVVEQASKLKQAVQEKRLLGDLNWEQEKFRAELKENRKKEEDAVCPWVGYREQQTMKEQILALSSERKHFLEDPPSGTKYKFDFDLAYPIALATLREDANLRKMRFDLVPKKVSEERFWRNYFYRVGIIKQSVQLETLQQQQQQQQQTGSEGGGPSSEGTDSRADTEDTGFGVPSTTQSPPHHHETLVKPGDLTTTTSVVPEHQDVATAAAATVTVRHDNDDDDDEDEDWERVLQQDVEGYGEEEVEEEKEGGENGRGDSAVSAFSSTTTTTTSTTTKADYQEELEGLEDDDPEILDMLQQIEQETE